MSAHMPVLTLNSHGHLLALLQPWHTWCNHLAAEVAGGFEGEVAQEELVPFCDLPALLGRGRPLAMSPKHQAFLCPPPQALRLSEMGSALPPTHSEGACKHRTSLRYWPGGEEVEMDNAGPCKGNPTPGLSHERQSKLLALLSLLQSPGLPSPSVTIPERLLTFSSLHW